MYQRQEFKKGVSAGIDHTPVLFCSILCFAIEPMMYQFLLFYMIKSEPFCSILPYDFVFIIWNSFSIMYIIQPIVAIPGTGLFFMQEAVYRSTNAGF